MNRSGDAPVAASSDEARSDRRVEAGAPTDHDRILTWVRNWLADDGRLLLMADFDGTLCSTVREPDGARLPADVRAHLRALADSPQARVAVLSGRDLCDLRARVGVTDAIYSGCHGLEIDGPDVAFSHPEAEAQQDSLRVISLALHQRARAVAGMRVEAKRLGVSLHYRDVPADQMHQVEEALARAIQRSGHALKVFHGSRVIEVLPQVSWNKGECALWIRDAVERLSPNPLLTIYLGDDWTDELAFEALAHLAITVKVGPSAPASRARYRLDDVEDAHALVAGLADLVALKGAV